MKPVLLLDGDMRRDAQSKLKPGDCAEKNILRITRHAGLKLERLPLVERPEISRKAAKGLVEKRRGIVISGSGLLHPTDDSRELGVNSSGKVVSTRKINSALLGIIKECQCQGVPLLGICYGHQMVARFAGETLTEIPKPEFGFYEMFLTESGKQDAIFAGVPEKPKFAEYHSLGMSEAKHTEVLGLNNACIQAIRVPENRIYGLQFHADFHWNVDNKGTGALKQFFQEENPGKELEKDKRIEPNNPFQAYSLNNVPLLNFMQMCENRK